MATQRIFAQLIGAIVLISLSVMFFHFAIDMTSARNISRNTFTADIFEAISENKSNVNLITSPISIESCVLLAFFGAAGETAEEMRRGLRLGTEPRKTVAAKYGSFLKNAFQNSANGIQMKMATRIYLNVGLEVKPDFTALAAEVFDTTVGHVHFADSKAAVGEINTWVEQHTHNRIRNLISEDDVNALTDVVLVNALYLKGDWAHPFSVSKTHKMDFELKGQQKVSVDMMQNTDFYNYAELDDLNATALEMPYADSETFMLVVLPHEVEGLQRLERLLALEELTALTSSMKRQEVKVYLPKFRIEFEVDLKQELQKLGMETMFTQEANFSRMLTTEGRVKISKAVQKTYLDVNEAGSEAAAATFIKRSTRGLRPMPILFRADHPFFFAIYSSRAVYFVGHLAKF